MVSQAGDLRFARNIESLSIGMLPTFVAGADKWAKRYINVEGVLKRSECELSTRSSRSLRPTTHPDDYHRYTYSLEKRLFNFTGKFRKQQHTAILGQSYKLQKDKIARRKWPRTKRQSKKTGLSPHVLGAMLYIEDLNWVMKMEERSANASEITKTYRQTYKSLQQDLFQWLLNESKSLDDRQYSKSVAVPYPPQLDPSTRSNYGIAITNLIIENMHRFLKCVNNNNGDCTAWSGCGLNIMKKKHLNKRKTKDENKRSRNKRKRKGRKTRRRDKKRKGENRRNKGGNKRNKKENRRRSRNNRRNMGQRTQSARKRAKSSKPRARETIKDKRKPKQTKHRN